MLPLDSHALKQALRYNGRNRRGQLQANAASGVTSLVSLQRLAYKPHACCMLTVANHQALCICIKVILPTCSLDVQRPLVVLKAVDNVLFFVAELFVGD